MTNYFTYSMCRSDVIRLIRKPMVKYFAKTEQLSQSLFYRVVFLYNKLPDSIRTKNFKQFSSQINKQIKILLPPFEIPKNQNI